MAAETADLIAELATDRPDRFGLPDPGGAPVEVRLLGSGESYTAWLVEVRSVGEPVVVRVASRPVHELPRPMASEFAALALVPAEIGPRPIRLEESTSDLGAPYLVTGYVPGTVVSPAGWTPHLLTAHARQLARLHASVHATCGQIDVPAEHRAHRLLLSRQLACDLDWWRQEHPQILTDPDVVDLLPRVEAFVAASDPVFTLLRRFTLVHGDLELPNILIDSVGVPRYVDWEWAAIGDPAQDLASLGGTVTAPPWYLPLDRPRIALLLAAYLRALTEERTATVPGPAEAGTGQGPADPDADSEAGPADATQDTPGDLAVRRDAWEVSGRFLGSLYFRTLRGKQADRRSGGRYAQAVHLLTNALRERLDRGQADEPTDDGTAGAPGP